MRVNLISTHRNQTGLAQDVDILQGVWTLADDSVKYRRIYFNQPQCEEAEINVFFEVLNPSLFTYAAKNVWIPNPEWAYKSWSTYLANIDEIWCKTHEAVEVFSKLHLNVKYIGWTSIAKGIPEKKNFHKAVVVTGKNIFRHPQFIVDAYASTFESTSLPELHVIYDGSRMKLDVPESLKGLVYTYSETLREKQYTEILQECGLAICVSGAEGFGHAVNEAASTGSVLLLNEIPPFKEFGYETMWAENIGKVPHPECYAEMYNTTRESVVAAMKKYVALTYRERKAMSEKNADLYVKRHSEWVESIKAFLRPYTTNDVFSVDSTTIPEEQLPGVTIVTPTRDRMKFMEVCAGCVNSQCYPIEKLEWIVIDDGKDTCEEFVKVVPFGRHVLETPGKTIAWKRNLGAKLAKFPVIVHFDDDDIYPPNSVLFRVSMMLRAKKQAVFCTTISCYDITNYISFVNVPPMRMPQSMRVSEATMCYTKSFWQEKGFDEDTKIAEGNTFIRGREHMCSELSPQEIIVSLVHPWTTSSRKSPKGMEPNGCHFGFTEDLFKMLSLIGQGQSSGAASS
jgi:hypothetical protein